MSERARQFVKTRPALLPKDKFRREEDKIPVDVQAKSELALVDCNHPEAREGASFLFAGLKRPDGIGLRSERESPLSQICAEAGSWRAAQNHSHEEPR